MSGTWMTYEEAGKLFGLSAEAIRKRSRRLRWQVQPPNDSHGKARILVPDGAQLLAGRPPGQKTEVPSGDRPDDRGDRLPISKGQEAIAEAIWAVLTRIEGQQAEALHDAQALAEKRGQELAELRVKLARQEAIAEGLQPLVARLQADRDALTTELASVYQEAQEARQKADGWAAELAEARERAGRAEAAGEAANQRAGELAAERDRFVHQVEAARAELVAWRMGGPIARAVRAFLYRRLA